MYDCGSRRKLRNTATIRTCDACAEEIYEDLQTGNNVITTTGNNKVSPESTSKLHVANTRPATAANRKAFAETKRGNEIFASVPSSSAMKVKCSKNRDNNVRFGETGRNEQRPNSPSTRIVPRKRQERPVTYQQYNSIIQQIPEIVTRRENSARRCREVLKDMNQLLRTSRKENFWYRWTLQGMGIYVSQSENNAAVMPASVRKQHSQAAIAANAHRSRVFTPKSGNVESTELSTEPAHSRSSPPVCEPGSTGSSGRLERRYPRFIRSHAVRERTPITRASTRIAAPMSTPIRSSFHSSTNSSFQNYVPRLPAVRMARTKQTARKVRDDRQREQSSPNFAVCSVMTVFSKNWVRNICDHSPNI